MALPDDFDETLEKVQKLGIADEPAGKVRDHLVLAVRTTAETSPDLGDAGGDLGLIDWSTQILRKCERALHGELCNPAGGGLKDEYQDILKKASGDDQVRAIASLVTSIIATVNPAIAVSSVVVYFALWLTKVGLTYWCKQPDPLLG